MTASRIERLRSVLEETGIEAILIAHGPNRRYVSGFTGTAGYVLVSKHEALLLTDFRYMDQAAEQAVGFKVVQHGADPLASIAEQVKRAGVAALAVEGKHLSLLQSKDLQAALGAVPCVPTADIVEKLRNIKDAEEIGTLREAARIADAAFASVLALVRPGVTERSLAAELEYKIRLLGADCGWPGFIVASGVRSALPHGVATGKEIGREEFVTFDFGAIVGGYMSDVTRTVFVGRASKRHREIYDAVLEANRATIRGLNPGMTGSQGDALGRDVIAARGFGEYFGHGLGHGIGLEIHEQLRLSKTSESVLEPGNVLTVEPGIYVPGFGGVRIEDDVLVTADGVEVLTSSPKELIEL